MTPTSDADDLVWYAAYGSNLWAARFLTYLTGGPIPHSPAGRIQAGAADPTPPRAHQPTTLAGNLFFAQSSRGWGDGGVAFFDPTPRPVGAASAADPGRAPVGAAAADHPPAGPPDTRTAGTCYGRLWLVTWDQFVALTAQENGRPVTLDPSVLGQLAADGHLDVCDGWYGRIIHLGMADDGRSIVTITCPDPTVLARRAPHPSYLRVIGLGLMEAWGMGPIDAAHYMAAAHRSARLAAVDATGIDIDVESLAADLTGSSRASARDE